MQIEIKEVRGISDSLHLLSGDSCQDSSSLAYIVLESQPENYEERLKETFKSCALCEGCQADLEA